MKTRRFEAFLKHFKAVWRMILAPAVLYYVAYAVDIHVFHPRGQTRPLAFWAPALIVAAMPTANNMCLGRLDRPTFRVFVGGETHGKHWKTEGSMMKNGSERAEKATFFIVLQ